MSPGSSGVSGLLEPGMNLAFQKVGNSSGHGLMEGGVLENSKGVIGVVDVYLHQARDIQNICIYHKQDVYAKICLTDDPEKSVLTEVVNGGGRDPVFNENLQLDVRSIETSLKCEIWMLSRIKNYLQDQLLGFALVPLTDIVIENGKLTKEFALTSDDMFHSPTGCVLLTLAYNGASPEVLEIPPTHSSLTVSTDEQGSRALRSIPREFEMIEFLDPKIAKENEMMVTEYYAIPCVNLDSEDPKSIDNIIPDKGIHPEIDASGLAVDSDEVTEISKVQASLSSVSINESPSGPVVTNSSSPSLSVATSSASACDTPGVLKYVNQDEIAPEEKREDAAKVSEFVKRNGNVVSPEEMTQAKFSESVNEDVVSTGEKTEDVAKTSDFVNQDVVSLSEKKTEDVGKAPVFDFTMPLINVNIKPEEVAQQDYIDLYMSSMLQFTESLGQVNLPMPMVAVPKEKDGKDPAKKGQTSKNSGPSSKVFYGSRAFF